MGYKHDRTTILAAAVEHAAANGLDELTYGKLAAALGIADRTIVYYFPWKAKLLEAVAAAVAVAFLDLVDAATGGEPVESFDVAELADAVVELDATGILPLYGETLGRASAGREPYAPVIGRLRRGWIERSGGAGALAILEGVLLAQQLDRAASTSVV